MGKLIVFEGTDGAGKSTQLELLTRRLNKRGIAFHRLRFPRYEEPSSALIRMYLGGEFGVRPGDVNAYAASAFYAVDRYASWAKDWKRPYEAGELFFADRYTTSNAVHQGSKLPEGEREAFFQWLDDFEFCRLGLPRPDLVLLLDLPVELSLELMSRRAEERGRRADIHEKDPGYLRDCRQTALQAARAYGWTVVKASRDGKVRAAEDIAAEIDLYIKTILEG